MIQFSTNIQNVKSNLVNILFVHHSECLIEKTIVYHLKNGLNHYAEIDIFSFSGSNEYKEKDTFLERTNQAIRGKNYNVLVIEGNLGKGGSLEVSSLCRSIINLAIEKNKKVIILIITGTVECGINTLKQYAEHPSIYYIMQKDESSFERLQLEEHLKEKVFKSFRVFDCSLIYQLILNPSSSSTLLERPLLTPQHKHTIRKSSSYDELICSQTTPTADRTSPSLSTIADSTPNDSPSSIVNASPLSTPPQYKLLHSKSFAALDCTGSGGNHHHSFSRSIKGIKDRVARKLKFN